MKESAGRSVIGGSHELVQELGHLAQAGVIEALELPARADLTINGDTVNPPSE